MQEQHYHQQIVPYARSRGPPVQLEMVTFALGLNASFEGGANLCAVVDQLGNIDKSHHPRNRSECPRLGYPRHSNPRSNRLGDIECECGKGRESRCSRSCFEFFSGGGFGQLHQ